jgi:hypothetical protein
MIFYSWVAVSESNRTPPGQTDPAQTDLAESEPPVAMGITDDRARAMKAAEETLGSGRAAMVIIEVVRPGMAARTLAPCYVRTGVGWLGRRTPAGGVAWDRFFV